MSEHPAPRSRVGVVVGLDPIGRQLVEGLLGQGWRAEAVGGATDFTREAGIAAALDGALTGHDRCDLVVCAYLDPAALVGSRLVDLDDDVWARAVDGTLDVARWVTRQSAERLREAQGTLVFAVPSVALVGAAGYVALTSAAEGVRGWAKSVAKQWATRRVTVHAVALALAHYTDTDVGFPEQIVSLTGPAFGSIGEVAADIAPVVATLARDEVGFLTGSTLVTDGGLYMGL